MRGSDSGLLMPRIVPPQTSLPPPPPPAATAPMLTSGPVACSAPVHGSLYSVLQHSSSAGAAATQQRQPHNSDSEIQPCTEEGEGLPSRWSGGHTGLPAALGVYGTPPSSRPLGIPIPSSSSAREGRTYRVVVSPSPSVAGNTPLSSTMAAVQQEESRVTVVLETGQQQPLGNTGQGSQQSRNFLGALFQRSPRGQHTPEGSTHGGDLLPHHYRPSPGAEAVLSASTSLEASSVLGRACGSLRRHGHTASGSNRLWAPDTSTTPRDTRSCTGGGAASTLLRGGRSQPSGIRAFASVDNLSALQSGQWARPAQQQQPQQLQGSFSQAPSPRTAELRYPQIAHLLQHSRSTGAATRGDRLPSAPQLPAGRVLSAAAATSGHPEHTLRGVLPPQHPAYGGAGMQRQLTKHASFAAHGGPQPCLPHYTLPQRLSRSSSLLALLQYEAGDPTMCAADIAVLSSSLPTNFAQPSQRTLQRVNSMTSPTAASLSRVGSSGALGPAGGMLPRVPSLASSMGEVGSGRRGGPGGGAADLPPAPPICLICLEMLTPEDFASGEAMQLECLCKGEVAMRHRACAIEWSNVKGNLLCDICKHPINNLPEIDPAIVAAREAARRRRQPAFAVGAEPTPADYIFDAIRVTWVTIICCILFVDGLSVSKTFLIGASVGMVYMWLSLMLQWAFTRWRQARRQALLQRQQQQQEQQQQEEAAARQQSVPPLSSADSLMVPLLIPGQAAGDELPV